MALLRIIPLTMIPLILYLLVSFGMVQQALVDTGFAAGPWNTKLFEIRMLSEGIWMISWGHALMTLGLFCLLVEIIKASNDGKGLIADHLISVVVFVIYLIIFIIYQAAAHSLFFLLMLMAFVDVVGGYVISLRAARRDIAMDSNHH